MTDEHLVLKIPGRIVGVDYGTVRVGLAICDKEQRWVSPLCVYQRATVQRDAEFFRQVVAKEDVRSFVVGLPIHLSGEASEKSREAHRFGKWIAAQTGCPVTFFDERFSSCEAEYLLRERGPLSRQKRRHRLDALAAQIVLQNYLEAVARGDHTICRSLDDVEPI